MVGAESAEAVVAARRRLTEADALVRTDPAQATLLVQRVVDDFAGSVVPIERGLHAIALSHRARIEFFKGDYAAASATATEAVELSSSLEDPQPRLMARSVLAHFYIGFGHEQAAIDVLEETKPLWPLVADPSALTRCVSALGAAYRRAGRAQEAVEALRYAADLCRATEDSVHQGNVLINLASAAWPLGLIDEARAALHEARRLQAEKGETAQLVWIEAIAAWVEREAGEHDAAIAHARLAIAAPAVDPDARGSAIRALAAAVRSRPESRPSERDEVQALLESHAEAARASGRHGEFALVARDLATSCKSRDDYRAATQWLEAAHDAERAAEADRRHRRIEADAFALRVARAEVTAAQLRIHATTLEAKNAELAQLVEERANLLATVAHDLRTPLTAIQLVTAFQRAFPAADLDETLLTVEMAVARAVDVIDGALSTEAIRTGRAPVIYRAFDLTSVATRCVRGLSAIAARKNITLQVVGAGLLLIRSDDRAISRIIENLVSNALKFSADGSRVEVRVDKSPGGALLEVLDEGPGFADADPALLFELGRVGLARPTHDERSTGVGLHIVFDLTNALGGSVALANREDRSGARVTVRLPDLAA